MTHSIITKLFFVSMNSFNFNFGVYFFQFATVKLLNMLIFTGDIVLFNAFTILVNILIITNENK